MIILKRRKIIKKMINSKGAEASTSYHGNYIIKGWFNQMKIIIIVLVFMLILFLPHIIKFMRITHLRTLGFKYEGDRLVRIQKDNKKINR